MLLLVVDQSDLDIEVVVRHLALPLESDIEHRQDQLKILHLNLFDGNTRYKYTVVSLAIEKESVK